MSTPRTFARLALSILLLLMLAVAFSTRTNTTLAEQQCPATATAATLAAEDSTPDPASTTFTTTDDADPDDASDGDLVFLYMGDGMAEPDRRDFPVQPEHAPDLPFTVTDTLAVTTNNANATDPLGYAWHVRNARVAADGDNIVFAFAGYAITRAPYLDIEVLGILPGEFKLDATMYTIEPDELTALAVRKPLKGSTRVTIHGGDTPLNPGDLGFVQLTANPSIIGIGETTTLIAQLLTPDRAIDPADGVPLSVTSPTADYTPVHSINGQASFAPAYQPATPGLKLLAANAPDYTPDDPNTLAVVAVEALTADRGTYVEPTEPDGLSYQYVPIDPAYPSITVTARPNIPLPDDKLPASWTLRKGEQGQPVPSSGGHPDDTRQKIVIDTSTPGEHLIIARCGSSEKRMCVVVFPDYIDLDIDSDNDQGFMVPEGTPAEDLIEYDANRPGKLIQANNGNIDNDFFIDYADGLKHGSDGVNAIEGADQRTPGPQSFVPIVVTLDLPEGSDWENATVQFIYSASNPDALFGQKTVFEENALPAQDWPPSFLPNIDVHAFEEIYLFSLPEAGNLRIWMKDGSIPRDTRDIIMNGDFISSIPYAPALLGLTPESPQVTLYVEGIQPSGRSGADSIQAIVTISGGDSATDIVNLTVFDLDLDIDSDNDDAGHDPEHDEYEDIIEGFPPDLQLDSALYRLLYGPKVIVLNHDDTDDDGIVDYADGIVDQEGSYATATLTILPEDLTYDATLRISFQYDGPEVAPEFTGEEIEGSGFFDYSANQTSVLRLWHKDAYLHGDRLSERLLLPEAMVNLDALGFQGGSTRLYLEGISPGSGFVGAVLSVQSQGGGENEADAAGQDRVVYRVVDGGISVNNANKRADNPNLLVGTPDIEFIIDEHDDLIEDQGEGFVFWRRTQSANDSPEFSLGNAEDYFPILIEFEDLPYGYQVVIRVQGGSIHLTEADQQLLEGNGRYQLESSQNTSDVIVNHLGIADDEGIILFDYRDDSVRRAYLASADLAFEGTIQVLIRDRHLNEQVVDEIKVSFKEVEDMYLTATIRSETQNINRTSFDERGDQVPLYSYANAHETGFSDPDKDKYFVFIHGYNIDSEQATGWANDVYRRLYWTGYRGNFVAVSWHGNENSDSLTGTTVSLAQSGVIDALPLISTASSLANFNIQEETPDEFDAGVENALQVALPLKTFLESIRTRAGSYENVDVMAHSLGNLLLWECLRYRAWRQHHDGDPQDPLFRNMLNVQAAVWSECFESANAIVYTAPDDPVTYNSTSWTQHSWHRWYDNGWFAPTGDPLDQVEGVYHAYYAADDVLSRPMRLNDYVLRGVLREVVRQADSLSNVINTGIRPYHYYRQDLTVAQPATNQGYRAPSGQSNRFLGTLPALIQDGLGYRQTNYLEPTAGFPNAWEKLSPPSGLVRNPRATDSFDSAGTNWSISGAQDSHSAFRNLDFPEIYDWYVAYLKPDDPNSLIRIRDEQNIP